MIVTHEDISTLEFDAQGLIPAVAQDVDSGDVLMVAWVNAEAIKETLARRRAVFWSRSRNRLWEKGESSGNTLSLVEVHTDCDRDTLLMLIRPHAAACHTGTRTCFGDASLIRGGDFSFLSTLERVIEERITTHNPESYTARLIAAGPKRLAQKVGEEGLETALALTAEGDQETKNEAADLLFHLAVALKARGLSLSDVVEELKRRHRPS